MKSPAELLRSGWFPALRTAAAALAVVTALEAASPTGKPVLPDGVTALSVLDGFRRSIWSEPIYVEFELHQIPRRGDETVYRGRLWGTRNEQGPVTRFELAGTLPGFGRHLLIEGGPDGQVWTSDKPGGGVVNPKALLEPLVPGLEMTPFDVQMPYLYWLDSSLVAVTRIRGRQTYVYNFRPPADFRARAPGLGSVSAYLDAQYEALVQSEVAGGDGRIAKTLSLLELRKVGDRWIPKDVDVRNEATRDKTRLTFTAVAIGVSLDPSAFDPSLLGDTAPPPPPSLVTRISQ